MTINLIVDYLLYTETVKVNFSEPDIMCMTCPCWAQLILLNVEQV